MAPAEVGQTSTPSANEGVAPPGTAFGILRRCSVRPRTTAATIRACRSWPTARPGGFPGLSFRPSHTVALAAPAAVPGKRLRPVLVRLRRSGPPTSHLSLPSVFSSLRCQAVVGLGPRGHLLLPPRGRMTVEPDCPRPSPDPRRRIRTRRRW